jgi:hypothetical protein
MGGAYMYAVVRPSRRNPCGLDPLPVLGIEDLHLTGRRETFESGVEVLSVAARYGVAGVAA